LNKFGKITERDANKGIQENVMRKRFPDLDFKCDDCFASGLCVSIMNLKLIKADSFICAF